MDWACEELPQARIVQQSGSDWICEVPGVGRSRPDVPKRLVCEVKRFFVEAILFDCFARAEEIDCA